MASVVELDGHMTMDKKLYNRALKGMYAMAVATFIPTTFIRVPYGRHSRAGWGPSISPRLAWFLMESPTLWMSTLLFPLGRMSSNPTSLILLMVFLAHYIHRSCIYPLRIRPGSKPLPISIAAMAFFFNIYNTYLQIRWISHYGNYTAGWLGSPTFIIGLMVFITGMIINMWADSVLLSLRRGNEGYKIPRGGLFEYVSCPNYFGEMVEWLGKYLTPINLLTRLCQSPYKRRFSSKTSIASLPSASNTVQEPDDRIL